MRDLHEFYINVAELTAGRSTCARKKVGAILVKDDRIISTGYNGVLSGAPHCEDMFFGKINWDCASLDSKISQEHHKFSSIEEVHAEQNVIAFAARHGVVTEGCTLYITLAPCPDCSKLIAAAGITTVVYHHEYDRNSSGVEFLQRHGITVVKWTNA